MSDSSSKNASNAIPGRVLGVSLPLNAPYSTDRYSKTSERQRFPNATEDWWGTPITVREKRTISFTSSITDKTDWQIKVRDYEMSQKWRKELAAQVPSG